MKELLADLNILIVAFLPAFIFVVWLLPLYMEIVLFVGFAFWLVRNGNQRYQKPPKSYKYTYKFKLQFTDSILKYNIMQGICFGPWFELLIMRWRYIDWRTYYLRIVAITALSIFNSLLSLLETVVWGKSIVLQEINDSPVFILGHPRTGTTLLHNLLSQDKDNFTFTSTFQAGFPSASLILHDYRQLFSGFLGDKRPMDNMDLSFDFPQEDELAMNVLTAGISPYQPLTFMECEPEYRDYFTFEKASKQARNRWIAAFLYLLQKVTYLNDPSTRKRFLLKSPVHTSRVKLLYQLFPKAQFIYIHREPYRVFKSAANLAQTTYYYNFLTSQTNERIQEFILEQYKTLYTTYMEAKGILPKGALLEVSFDELTNDMVGTLEKIYHYFQWPGWEHVKPELAKYVEGQRTYKKNAFTDLDESLKDLVFNEWKESFHQFNYAK